MILTNIIYVQHDDRRHFGYRADLQHVTVGAGASLIFDHLDDAIELADTLYAMVAERQQQDLNQLDAAEEEHRRGEALRVDAYERQAQYEYERRQS